MLEAPCDINACKKKKKKKNFKWRTLSGAPPYKVPHSHIIALACEISAINNLTNTKLSSVFLFRGWAVLNVIFLEEPCFSAATFPVRQFLFTSRFHLYLKSGNFRLPTVCISASLKHVGTCFKLALLCTCVCSADDTYICLLSM